MKLISRVCSLCILFVFLVSCGNQPAASATETPIPKTISPTSVPTSTSIPIIVTPSPLPTQLIVPMIIPNSIQLERWKEYQIALAKLLLSSLPPEEVLCEWEILGQSEQDVYVWATCRGIGIGGLEDPAVIHLGIDGAVQSVEIPGPGTHYAADIRKMFPTNIQDMIFGHTINYQQLSAHLKWRLDHPKEPPLIVLSATPIP